MKIKEITAKDNREAMRLVREQFGEDAVIISNKVTKDGIQVVAADSMPNNVDETPNTIDSSKEKVGGKFLQSIATEFAEIKNLLKEQLSSLTWEKKKRQNPVQSIIIRILLEAGFAAHIAKEVAAEVANEYLVDISVDIDELWEVIVKIIESKLKFVLEPLDKLPHVLAVIGPCGSGKTTNIAKLAANYSLSHGGDSVAFLTVDVNSIGSYEKLKVYANIFKFPIKVANDYDELSRELIFFKKKEVIFLDASLEDLDCIRGISKAGNDVEVVLALPAVCQKNYLEKIINKCINIKIRSVIITKVDEAESLGEVLSLCIDAGLPIQYISTGRIVPDDIKIISPNDFISETICKNYKSSNLLTDDELARKYFEAYTNDI